MCLTFTSSICSSTSSLLSLTVCYSLGRQCAPTFYIIRSNWLTFRDTSRGMDPVFGCLEIEDIVEAFWNTSCLLFVSHFACWRSVFNIQTCFIFSVCTCCSLWRAIHMVPAQTQRSSVSVHLAMAFQLH